MFSFNLSNIYRFHVERLERKFECALELVIFLFMLITANITESDIAFTNLSVH